MHHRSDIDGLRAIAILAVIGSHVGLPGLIGGYVGVDIFFVISGFLITGLLVAELRGKERIGFAAFYARRFRRLLPALALVLVATLVLGLFVLPPLGERQELGTSAMATSAFMSNIFFWRVNSDYFAPTAETLPLPACDLGAVEEQFYFVWPLALAVVAVVARRRRWPLAGALALTFVVLGVVSLALCIWATYARPVAAFYLMPPRAWEFAVGGLLALLVWTPSPRLGSLCLWSGLALMLAAIVGFDEHTRFPGSAAIVPVAGAALFILGAPAAPLAWPLRYVLTTRPVVWIGLLSYSWYLWHWPLLALTRFQSLGESNRWRDAGVALVALLAADLTWRFVENPVRRGRPWPFSGVRTTVTAGIAISAALVAVSYGLYRQANQELHDDARLGQFYAARHDEPNWPAVCSHYVRPFAQLSPVQACTLGTKGPSPSIVVWGDSHGFHFIPMAAEFGRRDGKAVLGRTMGACPPFAGPQGWRRLQQRMLGLQRCDTARTCDVEAAGTERRPDRLAMVQFGSGAVAASVAGGCRCRHPAGIARIAGRARSGIPGRPDLLFQPAQDRRLFRRSRQGRAATGIGPGGAAAHRGGKSRKRQAVGPARRALRRRQMFGGEGRPIPLQGYAPSFGQRQRVPGLDGGQGSPLAGRTLEVSAVARLSPAFVLLDRTTQ